MRFHLNDKLRKFLLLVFSIPFLLLVNVIAIFLVQISFSLLPSPKLLESLINSESHFFKKIQHITSMVYRS